MIKSGILLDFGDRQYRVAAWLAWLEGAAAFPGLGAAGFFIDGVAFREVVVGDWRLRGLRKEWQKGATVDLSGP